MVLRLKQLKFQWENCANCSHQVQMSVATLKRHIKLKLKPAEGNICQVTGDKKLLSKGIMVQVSVNF